MFDKEIFRQQFKKALHEAGVILSAEAHNDSTSKELIEASLDDILEVSREKGTKPIIILENVSCRLNEKLKRAAENNEYNDDILKPNILQKDEYESDFISHKFGEHNLLEQNKEMVFLKSLLESAIKKGIIVVGAENKSTGFGYLKAGGSQITNLPGKFNFFPSKVLSSIQDTNESSTLRKERYLRLIKGNKAFSQQIIKANNEGYGPIIFLGGMAHIPDIDLKHPNYPFVKGVKTLLSEAGIKASSWGMVSDLLFGGSTQQCPTYNLDNKIVTIANPIFDSTFEFNFDFLSIIPDGEEEKAVAYCSEDEFCPKENEAQGRRNTI